MINLKIFSVISYSKNCDKSGTDWKIIRLNGVLQLFLKINQKKDRIKLTGGKRCSIRREVVKHGSAECSELRV